MATIRVIEFKTDYKNDRATDMVLLAPAGENFDKVRTWHRVEKLRPPLDWDETQRASLTYQAMAARWEVVGPAYEAWRAGNAVPETGTPLAAWSGVTPDQAAVLKSMGLTTVESVRDMSESALTRLPFPGARQFPKLAGDFLSGKDVAAKDRQIAEMEDRMKAMEEMLEAKRGPGRPRKDEAA